MKETNSFTSGLNKDISRTLYQKDSYVDALNFQLVADKKGLNTGALLTVNGNSLFVELPDTSNTVSISKNTDGTSIVTILGQTFTVNFTSLSWQNTLTQAILANATLSALGILAQYNTDRVVIWSGLDTSLQLITSNITASINNTNGTVNTNYLSAVQAPKIMGWGLIREDIYLFSTTETSLSPVNSQGQIWKFTYDKFTYETNLVLIYQGNLNFSLGHPIPNPGGVLGNYETPLIQNLYFTDNYNTPKKINTIDANLMASTPSSLESIPDVIFGVSNIQQIIYSGNTKVGNYAFSYRLLQNTGGTSNFFPPSNYIPIVSANELNNLRSYQTDDSTTDASGEIKRVPKSIRTKIFNIDTSFDRIEPVVLYKSSEGVPVVTILPSQPIPANGIFEFIYSGNETGIDYTLEEFSSQNIVFETVKTITSKNNIKFNGNVKYSDFDVNFDARAYRFSGVNSVTPRIAELTNSQGVVEYNIDGTSPNYIQVPETADAIQDAEIKQAPYSYDNFLYQTDGVTFGGSGLNVSYTFETIDVDQTVKNDPYKISLDANVISGNKLAPYAIPLYSAAVIDLDQNSSTQYDSISNNGALDNAASPYHQYQIKGYQRDEVYRFAIVFFSKKGETSYAHWIADIRMPNVWMPSQDPGKPANNRDEFSYPSSSFSGTNWYGNTLGINFTIDISSIRDQISGYKIVRVKRADEDKTILGQGVLMPVISITSGTIMNYTVQNESYYYNTGVNPSNAEYSPSLCTFASPEFLFKSTPSFGGNDQIDIIGNLQLSADGGIYDSSFAGTLVSLANYQKNYRIENGGTAKNVTPITLFNSTLLDTPLNTSGITTYTLNGLNIENSSNPDTNAGTAPKTSYGNKRLAVVSNFTGHYGPAAVGGTWEDVLFEDDITSGTGALYLANYRRPNSAQYGGKSYSERSYSEYISTGNYRQVLNSSTSFNETVFGGDIQVSAFDYVNGFKNYFGPGTTYLTTILAGLIVPIECTFPIQLESNTNELSFNKGIPYGNYPWGTTPVFNGNRIEIAQEFVLNFDFIVSNDSLIYNPKPFPYLPNDKYDVRIHKSQTKINGELTDSWGIYKEDEYIDVNTTYGELNQLMVHQDRLVGFQSHGISAISVNDRSVITDNTGAPTSLGQTGVLSRYDYISTTIGSQHQFSFIKSNDAIFFVDISTKSIYKLTGNPLSLSITKGLSSYLYDNLNGLLLTNDNPYLNRGITGTYNFKYNEAVLTFKDTVFSNTEKANIFSVGLSNVVIDYGRIPVPACITVDSQVLVQYIRNGIQVNELMIVQNVSSSLVTLSFTQSDISSADSTLINISCSTLFDFTIAYNDVIDHFTSFYSYKPYVYVNDIRNIFTPDINDNNLWIHEHNANYGRFYNTVYPSTLKLLVNPAPDETKVFQTYEAVTESTNQGANIVNDFFNKIRVYTDYQNSDFQDLPIDGTKQIARRVERNWNISYLYSRSIYNAASIDIFNPANIALVDPLFPPRFRDKFLFIDLVYNNSNNNRFVLNSFSTNCQISPR